MSDHSTREPFGSLLWIVLLLGLVGMVVALYSDYVVTHAGVLP